MFTIGFDIGGTKTSSIVGDESGCFEGFSSVATPMERGSLLTMLRDAIESYKKRYGCAAVGIGIAGAKRSSDRLWTPNIPAADGFPLAYGLSEQVGLPVFIENDAHTALLGERWLGSLQGEDNAMLLSVGTGIGSAVVLDGRILRGAHNVAGSVGWLCMSENGEHMLHYEELASGSSLNVMAENAGFLDSRKLISMARSGDLAAKSTLESWVKLLAAGIASLASAFDLSTISLAGGISEEFDLYARELTSYARRFASPTNASLSIRKAELGSRAGVCGAVKLALDNL